MTKSTSKAAKIAFVGLNALRITSLIVLLLVFATLIMGLVEDIRDYRSDAIMDVAEAEDCAYVPGTSIPMQTWGIFWVELHRALLVLGVVALFFAELSWFGNSRLEHAAKLWFPVLSRTRGLAALGTVHVVIATSILSHYLDEFPLVVSWMLFTVGVFYLCLGLAFHSHPLKDGRSLFATKRKNFIERQGQGHMYHSFGHEKGYGAITSTGKSSTSLRRFFKPKGGQRNTHSQSVSIHETFPSLETASHKQVLADRARRTQHCRTPSSVAVDMSIAEADRSSITRDFVYNARAGVVHEREPSAGALPPHHDNSWGRQHASSERRDSDVSHQSCSAASIASSTQIRIGGYTSQEATRARERARHRRVAGGNVESSHPPPAKSTGQGAKTSKIKTAKRRSIALVNTARNRLSAGTASALAARRRHAVAAQARGIPNTDTEITIEYIDDDATAPPVPPLPAYHQATSTTHEMVQLPVASRFARNHVA